MIAFSTSSGNTAKDGKGNNSIYTYHLINNIKKYGLSISDVFSKTRDSVMKLTDFSQIPWEYSSLLESDGGFTFDNISIPNQLKRITRNKFDVSYSATYIDGVFYIVGDSNEIYLFGEGGTISKSIKIHPDEGFRSVEKIASNSHALAFVSDSGCFGYINLTSNKFISYKFEEALFAVSINDDDVAILGGTSDKLKFIDINRGLNFEMDLGEEVLSLMFKDSESLKYAASKLTIMTSCFSKKDKNIFAFGGSASVFGIIDVEQKKCLFANKDNSCFTYTYCVDFSHDGKYIVSSHESGKVNLWCAETYKMLYTFKINECINKKEFFEFEHEKICNHMHHVRFLPNSKAFAVSTSESQVIFFDFCKKVIIDKVDLNIEPLHVYSFEFTSSGKEMVISIGSKHYLLTTKTDQ
ncbi:caspase family protein [Aeromonas veronii]|nr:caspase family protein [Aeromonas veronii]